MRVLGALWRASLMTSMQYRADFLVGSIMAVGWAVWTMLPLFLVFRHTDTIEGWAWNQALMVIGFQLYMRGVLYGLIEPNLTNLVGKVRDGTLDFVLIKPADAQLLVSFARIVPARLVDLVSATGLVIWSLQMQGHVPSLGQIAGAALCLLAGVIVMYSIWLMAAATAFWWVRVDSLSHLLGSVLDAGHWPIQIYRSWVRAVLTFVIPVAVMTTYPAMALIGWLEPQHAMWTAAAAVVFFTASRALWRFAVSHYTSASS